VCIVDFAEIIMAARAREIGHAVAVSRVRLPILVLLVLLAILACDKSPAEPSPEPTPPSDAPASFVATATFTLGIWQHQWSSADNLVFCRHYAEPDRGDYVWIRFSQTAEQDGDAGPHIDIDLCRLSDAGQHPAPMPAGAHGSHCAPTPGFAIWWHEGENAFNSGAAPAQDRCSLSLEHDREAGTLSGHFACEPLVPASHEPGVAPPEVEPVAVSGGEFTCKIQTVAK
jgi:hypothetical protein